jgi:FkbM family methyltransferase
MTPLLRALLPRTIRPRRILAGPLRGAWLVTSWHDYPAGLVGRTERALLDWFAAQVQPGETWLDVGAHYGYTTIALGRLVGPRGRVFAFEPVPATAGCVDQGRALNDLPQVDVVPLGLGSVEKMEFRRIALTRGMADSTFGGGASSWFVTAGIVRFDGLWTSINGGNDAIHGVKIDVQGMELEALDGMREALARWRPRIVLELHAGVSREAVLSLLRELGYSSEAVAIEPARGERTPQFLDDHSYAFHPA